MNAGNHFTDQGNVVCKKKIGANLGCAGEMDCICRWNPLLRANPCIQIGCFQSVRYYLHKRSFEYLANFSRCLKCTHLVWTYENLTRGERAGTKPVLPFLHLGKDMLHAFC